MSLRKELRQKISDILERGESDRSLELWHSDIARMTDMMLYLYTEYAKPMTYSKGSLIELSHKTGNAAPASIEKTETGYIVKIDGHNVDLTSISSTDILRSIQKELLYQEFIDWDYYCDMV